MTEIGFRSINKPWLHPHAEAGNSEFNEKHQAICYEAVFQAMANYPVIDGILWWKWPTNLGMTAEQDRRFVPSGKITEKVILQWFTKKTPPEAGVTKN